MKKKFMCVLAIAVILVMVVSSVSMAKPGNRGNGHGNKCELRVSRCVGTSKEMKKLVRMVDQANKKIEQLVKRAQATPWNDVPQVLREVDSIVDRIMSYADRIGATVVCEYVEYYIDGQYVLIDPLRVVNV